MDEEIISHRYSNFVFVFLIAISILLLSARLNEYVRSIKTFLFYIVIPTPQASSYIINSNRNLFKNIKDIIRVHQENLVLRQKLQKYAFLENKYQRVIEENKRLRPIVNFCETTSRKCVAAQIISREPSSWFQWIIINRGSEHGITLDSPVIVWYKDKPVILGRVGEVYGNNSKVVLITNILSAIPVITKSSNEDGLLEGQNEPLLKLNYLVPGSKVFIGEEIVVSPISSVFPPRMIIGKIKDIEYTKNEPFHSATIDPYINLNSIKEVIVLINQ